MRHGNTVNKLGRTYSHRQSLLANLAISLIEHKRIRTTLAKAKELRKYVEPLITKSKNDTTHSRRVVFAYLNSKDTIKELFGEIGPKVASRPGGYTRILKLGARQGDNAEMALIELVDYNEYLAGGSIKEAKAGSRRRRPAAGAAKKAAPAAKGASATTKGEEQVTPTEAAAIEAPQQQALEAKAAAVDQQVDQQDAGIHNDNINPSGNR